MIAKGRKSSYGFTERRHHIKKVFKRHTAIIVGRKHFAYAISEGLGLSKEHVGHEMQFKKSEQVKQDILQYSVISNLFAAREMPSDAAGNAHLHLELPYNTEVKQKKKRKTQRIRYEAVTHLHIWTTGPRGPQKLLNLGGTEQNF